MFATAVTMHATTAAFASKTTMHVSMSSSRRYSTARASSSFSSSTSSNSNVADNDDDNDATLATPYPIIPDGSPDKLATPVSQRRVFDQMITLRTRLNERVAKTNQFAKYLEQTLVRRDAQLVDARQALRRAMLEAETLKMLAQDALVAAERGDGNDERAKKRLDTLRGRLERVHKTLREDEALADAGCLRSIPITWTGNASDVQLMGDFDQWTKGIQLSPEFFEGGTNNHFRCDAALPPGEYQVKFLVDGEWRTTDDWPSVGEGLQRNNVLVIV